METENAVVGDSLAEGASVEAATPGEVETTPESGAEGVTEDVVSDETPLYQVRVNGRIKEVTLDDLVSNYSKGEDYTRKTQELAQQREQIAQMAALQAALERDPRTTLATLASALGVDLGFTQSAQQPAGEQDPYDVLVSKVDNLASTLTAQQQAALQAQQQAQQQAMLQRQIEQETADLKSIHGDFDERALWQYAAENGTPNLAVAYRAWQFEQEQQRRIAETNRAVAAKRKQAAVVSGGHSTTSSGAVVPGSGAQGRMSVREAFLAAAAAAK